MRAAGRTKWDLVLIWKNPNSPLLLTPRSVASRPMVSPSRPSTVAISAARRRIVVRACSSRGRPAMITPRLYERSFGFDHDRAVAGRVGLATVH